MHWKLALAGLACLAQAGWAGDLIAERAYFEDKTGRMSFEEARKQAYTPFHGTFVMGYSSSVFWFRLRVSPVHGTEAGSWNGRQVADLVLRLRPVFVDELEMFDPLRIGGARRLAGDRQDQTELEYRSLNHNFVIPAENKEREVWLRMKTASAYLLHVEALTVPEAIWRDRLQEAGLSIYAGVMLLLMLWAFVQWYAAPEPLMLAFVVHQGTALMCALSYLGYFRLAAHGLIPAVWLDRTHILLTFTVTATAIWFYHSFLKDYRPPRMASQMYLSMLGALPVELALAACGQVTLALRLNIYIVAASSLLLPLLSFLSTAKREESVGAGLLFSRSSLTRIFMLLSLSVCLYSLLVVGRITGSPLTLYVPMFSLLFSGAIVFVLLLIRTRRLNEAQARLSVRLQAAEQQVEREREFHRQQTDFLAMLAHELKTPMSVLRMVVGSEVENTEARARADRAIRSMAGVVDRCTQAEQLCEATSGQQEARCMLREALQQCRAASTEPERLDVRVEADLPDLTADPQLVSIILGNLVENAVKYAAAGSRIDVHARRANQDDRRGVSVDISNLPGTAGRPDPGQVFRKYYRGAGAQRMTGTGLGLYLSASMAQRLQGQIRYLPDAERVRFELWLPA